MAPWLLVAAGHVALYGALADVLPPVWLELPVLVWLGRMAKRGRLSWNLVLCFATVSGLLLSEPATGMGPLTIWAAMIPLLFVIQRTERLDHLFIMGLWTGAMVAAGVYSWLIRALISFFETSAIIVLLPYLAAAAIIGFPFAAFMPAARFLTRRLNLPLALLAPGLWSVLSYWWVSPLPLDFELALVWRPEWLQLLPILGPQGMEFVIVAVNALLFAALSNWANAARSRRSVWIPAIAGYVLLLGLFCYGMLAIHRQEAAVSARVLDIAVVQPVSPLKIHNNDFQTQAATAQVLKELSMAALRAGHEDSPPDVIIWPEGAGPFAAATPEFNPVYMQAVMDIHSSFETPEAAPPILLHNVEFVLLPGESRRRYYSAITLVAPPARPAASYHKAILMPFSEYIPFERTFPFLRQWLPESRTILRGETPAPIPGPGGHIAPLICYEVLFPDYVRRLVKQDAAWIANLTNDRWYGSRQQARQHLGFAVLRAIENRRPMARATNSGISALIQDTGRIEPGGMSRTLEPMFLRGPIEIRSQSLTFYSRYGDILNHWALPPLYLILLACSIFLKKTHR